MASTYLTRTPSSAGNRKTFTWSAWVKRCSVDSTHYMVTQGVDSSNNWTILFDGANKLQTWNYVGGFQYNLKTTRVFRDTNAWYHIVVAVDTTQSTSSDRVKIYVNGVQETSFVSGEETYPSQNADMYVNSTNGTFRIGFYVAGGSYFNGLMSHVHFCDGTAYAPTEFGETDANGVWKIKTSPSVTYGTNGFFILKDGNSVTDQSGNSNNFTVAGGTLTNTEDCPSNVFATWNPLTTLKGNNSSLSNGNTTLTDTGTTDTDGRNYSTIGASSGKWYFEIKASAFSNNGHTLGVSFSDGDVDANSNDSVRVRYTTSNNTNYIKSFGTIVQSNLTSFSAGSIIGVAVDLDNGTVQFYVNGSTYGSQVTGLSGSIANKTMFVQSYGEGGSGRTFTLDTNFGNGYFGTTAVASAGTNASGIGIFEYDVPTGYTALSTKGLNL